MDRIIAIANQKGGVGKTTTTINLAACLAEKNYHVLVIDADPQGNTTSGLGFEKDELEYTLYELMLGNCNITQCTYNNDFVENLDIWPSNVNLSGAEIELLDIEDRESILKKLITKVKSKYDFVLIDCPPALTMLTVNAMTAADSVLVPIQCEYYALEGLTQLMHTVELVKARLNKRLKIEGVVFTMYDSRTNLSQQVVENVRANFDRNVYETVIPRNVRLAEAPSYGVPITVYDPKSTGAERYRSLANEMLAKHE